MHGRNNERLRVINDQFKVKVKCGSQKALEALKETFTFYSQKIWPRT